MSRGKWSLLLILVVSSCAALFACSRAFDVQVEGRYDQAVFFRFYELMGTNPIEHNVIELTVQEQIADHQWDTVWALSGEQSLTEIRYGTKYDNLNEIVSAKPLSLKMRYRVSVKDSPRFDPPGSGGATFTFDESGKIVTLPYRPTHLERVVHQGCCPSN